jgi:hypothetical protein
MNQTNEVDIIIVITVQRLSDEGTTEKLQARQSDQSRKNEV